MNSFRKVIFLLIILISGKGLIFSQAAYNNCSLALELCPNISSTLNNLSANKTLCAGCEDDFALCFTPNNTIWAKFTTNKNGGDVQVNFSNLVFETNPGQDNQLQASILQASQPCSANSYVPEGNCEATASTNFSLSAINLLPLTTYYILINGDYSGIGVTSAAECTFDILVQGPGVNRIPPTLIIYSNSLTVCSDELVTLTAHLSNCPDSTGYKWFINDELVASTLDSIYHTTDLKDGDIVSVSTSCYSLCTQVINSSTPPIEVTTINVDAGEDATIINGQNIQLHGSTNGSTYNWSPGESLSAQNILDPVATPSETTIYTLQVKENNCTNFDEVTITIDQDLVIPTTFSPNNDGINDVWELLGIENYPDCYIEVFDRLGQKVFQKTAYSLANAWTGEINGKEMATGVYFYYLELRDEENNILKGNVTVVR